jgi:hypothetical protein
MKGVVPISNVAAKIFLQHYGNLIVKYMIQTGYLILYNRHFDYILIIFYCRKITTLNYMNTTNNYMWEWPTRCTHYLIIYSNGTILYTNELMGTNCASFWSLRHIWIKMHGSENVKHKQHFECRLQCEENEKKLS